MTQPSPDTLERETDKLFVTDAELIRRLGVPENILGPINTTLNNFNGPFLGGRS